MNILVTLNSNYIPPLSVMLRSLRRVAPGLSLDLYVAHSSLSEADFQTIANSCDGTSTRIHPVSIAPDVLADAPILKRLSKETYYRLLAIDFLPKDVDRILYIDPDTVFLRSPEKMYELDFGTDLLAAAGHTSGWIEKLNHLRLHMAKNSRYINAGIILMNIAAMRKEISVHDIFEYIAKNSKKLYLGDQDVFNGMFSGRIRILDEKLYNLDEKTFAHYRDTIDLDWVAKNTVIVHYNGQFKPWKEGYRGVLQHFYFEAADEARLFLPPERMKGEKIA